MLSCQQFRIPNVEDQKLQCLTPLNHWHLIQRNFHIPTFACMTINYILCLYISFFLSIGICNASISKRTKGSRRQTSHFSLGSRSCCGWLTSLLCPLHCSLIWFQRCSPTLLSMPHVLDVQKSSNILAL